MTTTQKKEKETSVPTTLPSLTIEPPKKNRIDRIWHFLSSETFLLLSLVGLLLSWGGSLLLQFWSRSSVESIAPWLTLLALLLLVGGFAKHVFGERAQQLFTWLVLLYLALEQVVPVLPNVSFLVKAHQATHTLTVELFQIIKLAGNELLGGALFFALFARLIERSTLLWFPPEPSSWLPQKGWLTSIPLTDKQEKTTLELSEFLSTHVDSPTRPPTGLLFAEKGRNATLGEVWILLGVAMALFCAGWMTFSPHSMTWTQVILGASPWLLIGSFLRASTSHVIASIWKQEESLILALYSDKSLAELQPIQQHWVQLFEKTNSEEAATQDVADDTQVED